jgi:hypothetical protein
MDTPPATALIVAPPDVVDVTVPVATPEALVTLAGWVMVSVAPRLELNVTVTPGTGLLLTSKTVTVMVLSVTPSATRLVGLAPTVEFVAFTPPETIFSICEPAVKAPERMVMVGVPVVVSKKKKLPVPDTIVTDVIVPSNKPELLVSNTRLGEFEERSAVPEKLGTRFPKESRITKVATAEACPDVTV